VGDLVLGAFDADTAASTNDAEKRIRNAPVKWARWKRRPEALARVLRFAADNELEFSPESTARDFHGRVWDEGTTYRLDHIAGSDGPDYGTVGRADRNGAIHRTGTGYLAIHLDRRLPHIVLQRRRGALLYAGDGPEFELEGDFGKHFELHVPTGYERDALYLLTPDVMQTLIDEAADQRVEIVDDDLFVFFDDGVDVTDPDVHIRMHRVWAAIAGQIVPQADGYRDSRSSVSGRVARAGRRLPPVVWIPGVVIAVGLLVLSFWAPISKALAEIFG
jgi:hypothetical protein